MGWSCRHQLTTLETYVSKRVVSEVDEQVPLWSDELRQAAADEGFARYEPRRRLVDIVEDGLQQSDSPALCPVEGRDDSPSLVTERGKARFTFIRGIEPRPVYRPEGGEELRARGQRVATQAA